jgi:hypothetical protein
LASIIDQMTEIYIFIDDLLKVRPGLANWRCSNNSVPAFTDAEVITVALMQSCLGVDTLKQTYNLIAENFAPAFPKLCSYQQWVSRLHRLGPLIGYLFEAAHWSSPVKLFWVDSKPIPVCKTIRHGRVRLLRDQGACFGKTSAGWFFGFKLHLMRDAAGLVVDALLTPANWDDRDPALEMAYCIDGGILLGDLGYRGPTISSLLASQSELLMLPRVDVEESNTHRTWNATASGAEYGGTWQTT